MIATARNTGATQLVYYLLLHFWMAAFGDSTDAMRTLSVLTMAGAAACVALLGRRLAGARARRHQRDSLRRGTNEVRSASWV